jgi:iron complex transport system permease protein
MILEKASRPSSTLSRRLPQRLTLLVLFLSLVLALFVASLALGSRAIDLATVQASILQFDAANNDHLVIWSLRLPRSIIAILAGLALGCAGALTQAVTRNPLAEPGLLGVNAGAATAVIFGVAVLGLNDIHSYLWFGLAGAALSSCAVFLLGRANKGGTDPVRLVLAGAGVSIVLGSVTGIIVLNAPTDVLDKFRMWAAGSVEGRDFAIARILAISVIFGSVMSMSVASGLNAVALGDELGRSLGAQTKLILAGSCVAVTILAGSATAVAGPITFLGLVAPQLARRLMGPDCRWIIPVSGLAGACVLLLSDIAGRLVAAPDEVAAGIIVLVIGGPFFVVAARQFRLRQS